MTKGKKDYSRLVRLAEELDNLLQFLLKLLSIKTLQTKLFIGKVGEILRILEMGRTTTLPEQLVEEILSLALPIGDDILSRLGFQRGGETGLLLRTSNSWLNYVDNSWIALMGEVPSIFEQINSITETRLEKFRDVKNILSSDNPWIKLIREVPSIVENINSITETRLEKFLDDTDLYNNWEELRKNLEVVTCRERIRNLDQVSRELKEALNFFHDVATETSVLSQYLKFVMTLVEDSEFSNECKGLEMLKCIGDAVSKALDAVQNSPNNPSLYFQMGRLDNYLSLQPYSEPLSARIDQRGLEEVTKDYFEGKNGVRLVLLETLGKLHSSKENIDMICQSRIPVIECFKILGMFSASLCFLFCRRKEKKEEEMIQEENHSKYMLIKRSHLT